MVHKTKPKKKSGVGFYQFGYQIDEEEDYHGHTEHVDTATNSKVGESRTAVHKRRIFCRTHDADQIIQET